MTRNIYFTSGVSYRRMLHIIYVMESMVGFPFGVDTSMPPAPKCRRFSTAVNVTPPLPRETPLDILIPSRY